MRDLPLGLGLKNLERNAVFAQNPRGTLIGVSLIRVVLVFAHIG